METAASTTLAEAHVSTHVVGEKTKRRTLAKWRDHQPHLRRAQEQGYGKMLTKKSSRSNSWDPLRAADIAASFAIVASSAPARPAIVRHSSSAYIQSIAYVARHEREQRRGEAGN